MEDHRIVDLYWSRDESAIRESDAKYGRMLQALAYSLLSSHEDAEECVNDTYLAAWDAIPPARPNHLGAFLSKITRRIAIDRWRALHRQKRGGIGMAIEELTECVPDRETPQSEYDNRRLGEAINGFLAMQTPERRAIFVRRYFCSQSTGEIARALGIGESKVKVTLHRMREKLRKELEAKELL